MDITAQFNLCLKERESSGVESFVFQLSTLNEFLKEAYRINSHISELTTYLRSVRVSYLTLQPHRPTNHRARHQDVTSQLPNGDRSQPLTDAQRTRIDNETRQLLTTMSSAIQQLQETTQISSDLDESLAQQKRSKGGFLGRWAAGGGITSKTPEELEGIEARDTIKKHRDSVIWFLQRRLEGAGEMQRSMVEVRVKREVERSRSVLYKARGPGLVDGIGIGIDISGSSANHLSATDPATRAVMESTLSPEQIQMFEREQEDMLRHYNSELDKIKTAEASLIEISSLQTELAANLEIQSEQISQLVADDEFARENVEKGNKNLKEATTRRSIAQMIFWGAVGTSIFVVTWDFIF
ncbi:snare protein syntaxin-like protein 18/UFE1 [Venturia nashicola]|uniref:Snare protein syntaxin-like protein 18/UFE1 n=1 Tax=Venturia nashicola TaxID=86259 RepID=A0A4Z1PEX1_9PEZI|nr:snare protein syntaxin-like protein 18/UFE1 [Venturia nashicola]TLD32173.1 snare protein syntaxin-like protein 18/UFE1 [Venturia nashicola]